MSAGTILLQGLDESLGNGPRRRTTEDTHAAERANAVISRCFGQVPHSYRKPLVSQVSLLNSVQGSIAPPQRCRCARGSS
jgi:hypothetical protein